ncbi:hypothetical protein GAYE_SCF41G5449 [Galdieria yellowstonensis]|uniref:Reverse transcriptase domain-containing protein n=1 Tax=Galdieria yellowstonensis TaxID=3028027 RepID=A0AAV9IJP6_9RHOD|nr:hypothetical protein GAYE_SCF41G5449 [Galdieria yellowstonensis]
MIFVRLFDRQRRTGFIFGTVYVPQYRSCRRLIWTSLQTMLGKIQARYPGMPILIAGDWNLTRGNLTRMLSRKHLHEILQVNPCRGSDKTWHRRVRGEWRTSGIDHILWSGASSHSTLSHSIVDRCWDLSDHWPISCKVHLERLSQEVGHGVSEANKVQYPRMRVDVLRERRDQIIHATQWQVLEVDVPGPDEPKDSSSHIETQGGQAEGVVSVPDQSIHSDAAESDALDRYASQVVETCHSIAKEYGAHVCPRRNRKGKGDFCLSKKTKRLIDQRRKTYHRLISSSSSLGNEDSALLLESYQQLRRQCHDSVNEDKRSSWHVKMKVIAQHAKKLRLRSLFRWLRGRIQGESTSKPGDKPMLRSGNASGSMLQVQPIQYDGQLHTDEASILKCWAAYYEKLSSDETGHSQDSNHWKDVFPIPFMNATTGRSTTSTSVSTTSSSLLSHVAEDGGSLDSPITPSELCSVLRTMANGKAPGKDQIPMEFWKLILPTSTCTDATAAPNISSSSSSTKTSTTTTTTSSSSTTTTTSSSSTTMTTSTTTGQERETGSRASLLLHNPMSRVLLRLLNWIFQSGKILSSWNSSLLISIPKKGDLKDMNNYRGISLISTIVKLLSAIVTNRIRYAVEKDNVLVREQAGFRTREECAAQVIALVECVQRRWNKEMRPTYACFIDLRKAFDRVPHEALFRKLESLGIRGRCLEFYRGLYRSSWTQVSSRISDTLSPAFPFCRGVRQGDPSSPLLFDLFINDLLEQCRPFGIRVVGMPESTMVGSTENRLPGLMFADDVVLLSPSRHCLEASMRKVSEYLTQLEMEVGASKCGVTVFHGCIDKVRRRQWQLQGKDIPVVEEYRYLGIDVNCNLDEGFTVRRQIQRYRQKLHMATPFLRNGRIPLDLRLRVVKSCLLPSLVWGSEWWGMHQLHAKRLSLVLNQTLRMVVGVHAKHTGVSIPALYTELGIPSMESLIAGRRARLWAKGPSMRTWISQLCQWIPTFRKGTWVKNTKAWLLRRLGSSAVREIERSPRGSKALQRAVQQVIHHKWLTTGKMTQTNTWQEYCQYVLHNGSALLRDSSLDFPEYSKSLSWLMRIRVGGWSSCSRLARIGILDEQWKTRCPCCLVNVPETLSHLQQERTGTMVCQKNLNYTNTISCQGECSIELLKNISTIAILSAISKNMVQQFGNDCLRLLVPIQSSAKTRDKEGTISNV